MKKKLKIFFKNIIKNIKNIVYGILVFVGLFFIGIGIKIGYNKQIAYEKITAIRHFVAHPSEYQIDTLYRKVNDTLYIDTIKVNYKQLIEL